MSLWLLLAIALAPTPSDTSKPWTTAAELVTYIRSHLPGPENALEAEKLLREATEEHKDDPSYSGVFGSWLFFHGRLPEAYPLLARACHEMKEEGYCAAAGGIDVAAGRWDQAASMATVFPETTCNRSNRLWVLKYVARDPKRAVERAQGLLREEPTHELSFLLLAASQHLAGDDASAREELGRGRATAKIVILLKQVSWEQGK
jgi:hypothetical protein